jgi:NADPH2:quinone reductase
MKAAYINQTGPAENIIYGDLPEPKLGRKQCLIKVSAVDVNPIDVYVRSGAVGGPQEFPLVMGRDFAGVIAAVGLGVKGFKVGDRVWGTNQGMGDRKGTFAELIAVDHKYLNLTPIGVTDEEAVALSLVGVTAYLGLVRAANLRAGQIVFVNGGSGGVGSAVVQIAKIHGAKVIATAGTEAKAAICRELGADLVINYKEQDVPAAIKAFAPSGVNLWWETLREPDFERAVSLLAMRGQMILMAGREARPVFPVGPFYVKDCSLHGFAMFNASMREQHPAGNALNRWMSEGKLKARIDRILPLSETAEAHRLQERSTVQQTGELTGKIVLKPGI